MSVIAIILASDRGEGFPEPKYTTLVDGVPMLRRSVEQSLSWDVADRVVVLGADADVIEGGIDDLPVTTLEDPEWEEGLAAPIRAALDLISRDRAVSHVVVARGDQPGVPAAVVDALVAHAVGSEADVVAPKYRFDRGWPLVVGQGLWRRLLGMEGDYDLHSLVSMHAAAVEEVWFDRLTPPVLRTFSDVRRVAR